MKYLRYALTDMNYAAHIARICKIEDIEVGHHSSGGRAWRRKRRINIRPLKLP